MLKSMVDANPQMKALISNPQLMKQMMSNMSNLLFYVDPAMMQQAMSQMGGMGGMGGFGGLGGMGGFGGLGGNTGVSSTGSTGLTGSTGSTSPSVDPKVLYQNQL